MLQEKDDDEDTVWTSNKFSTADRMPAQPKIVQTNHLGNIPATSHSFLSTKKKEEVQYAISDSGATGHFLVQGAPVVNKN